MCTVNRLRSAVVAACAMAGVCAQAGASSSPLSDATMLRLGPMTVAPIADDVISAEEMAHSSKQYGLVSTSTRLMATRYNMAYVGWTEDGLYAAFRTSTPPRPQQVTDDDWIEVTVLPPNASKPKSFRRPIGRKLKGAREWGVECAETEIFLPLAKLGARRFENGQAWGLQLTLHFSSCEETAVWHLPAKEGEVGTFIPDRAAPVVGLRHFSDVEDYRQTGTYYTRFDFVNPTEKPVRFHSKTIFHHGINSSKLDSNPESAIGVVYEPFVSFEGLVVSPGGKASRFRYDPPIWPGSVNILDIDVRTDAGCVYRRKLRWDLAQGLAWKDPVGLPKLTSGYWPSFCGLVRVKAECCSVTNIVKADVRVVGADGNVYWEEPLACRPYLPKVTLAEKALPDLPYQDYFVRLAAKTADGRAYADERTFAKRKLPWQGLDLGKEDVVVPPFKPIAAKDDRIDFTLTGFGVKGLFWDAVYAKGENILAAPVTLALNGRPFVVTSVRTTVRKGTRLVRELECRADCADAMKLRIVQDYDYDGLCEVTMEFDASAPVEVDSLRFSVPLKADIAKYYTVGWNRTPRNEMGCSLTFPPSGDGEIWNSKAELNPYYIDLFGMAIQPYFWYGAAEKGIAWYTESNVGIFAARRAPVQRVVRRGGAAVFEMDYVSSPVEWIGRKTFRFGFQPTPVKPVNDAYYAYTYAMYSNLAPTNAATYIMGDLFKFGGTGLKFGRNRYPEGGLELMHRIRKMPLDITAYEREVERYFKEHGRWFAENENLVTADFYRQQILPRWRWMNAKAICRYIDPVIDSFYWDEWEMYKAEWGRAPWPVDFALTEYGGAMVRSRIDQTLYDGLFGLRHGFNGVYYDCFAMGKLANDVSQPEGAERDKLTGDVSSSLCDIRAWRELVKRTAVMCYLNGGMHKGTPLVDFHTTCCYAVPVVSWCSTVLGTECGSAGGDFQDRFPEGYTLSSVVARQSGSAPRFITSTRVGDKARREREVKSLIGYMCAYGMFYVHDQGAEHSDEFCKAWNTVFDFGWAKDDVKRYFYYDEGPKPVLHTGANTRLTVQKRGDRALLMFGGLGEAEEVRFDANGLGFGPDLVYVDAMTGERLAKPQFVMERHGYRLICVEADKGND